jgi:hypothetical protein
MYKIVEEFVSIFTPDIVLIIIWSLAALCLLFGLVAYRSICEETRALSNFKVDKFLKDSRDDDDIKLALVKRLYLQDADKVGSWNEFLQRFRNNAPSLEYGKKKNGRRATHLDMRLQSLFRGLADDNGARQLPKLHDLHEMTLQDELGKWSPTVMQTIISVLLIVGIFGTLSGVHDAILHNKNSQNGDLSLFARALLPSMVAVGCTVVLMWLRGFYLSQLNAFLRTLDTLTMAELIPRMQPQNSMNKGALSMNQSATGFYEKIKKLQGTLEALRQMSETMNSAQSKYKESLSSETNFRVKSIRNDYEALKNKLKRTMEEADDSSLKIGEIEKAYNTMQQQASKLCSQWEASDKLSYDSVLNAVDQIAHDEDEYRASMNSLNAKLEEEIAGIRQREEECIKLTEEWMNALGNYNADSRGHFRHCLCDVLILFAIATLFAYGLFVWRNNEVSDLKKQNQALYGQNQKLQEQNKGLDEQKLKLDRQKQVLQEQYQRLYKQNKEFDEQNQKLQKQNKELDEQKLKLDGQKQVLQEQYQKLYKQYKVLQEQNKGHQETEASRTKRRAL